MSRATAVGVIAYDRPHYFEPTLRGLLSNSRLQDCDLWFFLDGGPGNRQRQLTKIVTKELARAPFAPRHLEIVWRATNLGCGRNTILARQQLFDLEQYQRVFVFEDDMIPSRHYLNVCERMLNWAEQNFSDVGVVQAFGYCWLSPQEKCQHLTEVVASNSHWWGYLMPATTWQAISELLLRFDHDFLKGRRYADRDLIGLRQWALRLIEQYDVSRDVTRDVNREANLLASSREEGARFEHPFPGAWDFRSYFRSKASMGQDAITALALALADLKKLVPVVNRGLPIGRRGIHSTDADFAARGFDSMQLHEFDSDASLSQFTPVPDPPAGATQPDRTASVDRLPLTDPAPPHKRLQPYMRLDEVRAIQRLLHERLIADVLEFGAGGSTMTFSQCPTIRRWWAIETDYTWARRVLQCVPNPDSPLQLLLWERDDYLSKLRQLSYQHTFDLYFVDGGERAEILELLYEQLQHQQLQRDRYQRHEIQGKTAMVLLHDYARPAYQSAISKYSSRIILTPPSGQAQGLLLLEP